MIDRDVLQARFNKLTKIDDVGELICKENIYPHKRIRFGTRDITLIALSYYLQHDTLPFRVKSTSANLLSVDPRYLESVDVVTHLNKGE